MFYARSSSSSVGRINVNFGLMGIFGFLFGGGSNMSIKQWYNAKEFIVTSFSLDDSSDSRRQEFNNTLNATVQLSKVLI
jgi:hypothetical protein